MQKVELDYLPIRIGGMNNLFAFPGIGPNEPKVMEDGILRESFDVVNWNQDNLVIPREGLIVMTYFYRYGDLPSLTLVTPASSNTTDFQPVQIIAEEENDPRYFAVRMAALARMVQPREFEVLS